MKKKLSTVLCVIAAVVLVIAASCIGAVRGWRSERENALHPLTGSEEMTLSLENRAMDAANLRVVASRHLPASDARLSQLQSASDTLSGASSESLDSLVRADALLTDTAASLGAELPTLASVKDSARDQAYISTLTRTLSQQTGLDTQFTSAACDFNDRLTGSLTGKLAILLGVTPLDIQ